MSIKQVREIKNADGQTERKLVKVSGPRSSNIDLRIGVPLFWRSTNLPPNHAWPDGSFVEFEDWPELAEVYEQDGFTGMLLPWDADAATQAANLGKFRPNAANPTGLYLPLHGGQFLRNWPLGDGQEAGAWGEDTIRRHNHMVGYQATVQGGGNYGHIFSLSDATGQTGTSFHGGLETAPQHVWQPVIIYLGRPR